MDDGCSLDQLGGPSLLTNGSSSIRGCLGNGVVRMGGTRGSRDDEATGGEGSVLGESSFRFPVTGSDWTRFHSGGIGLLNDGSLSVRGFFGSKGVVRLGVIETMRGNSDKGMTRDDVCGSGRVCDNNATGGDDCGVILGNGGTSHRRGIRSSEEGAVHLTGGISMFSVCWVTGIDMGKDGGRGTLTGSGVLSIETGGSYCSIDKYCHRCSPQGIRGNGGDAARGDSTGGGLG